MKITFTPKELKSQANELFKSGKVEQAFNTLLNLPSGDFIEYNFIKRPIWKRSKNIQKYFWTQFIVRDNVWKYIFSSNDCKEVFYAYFINLFHHDFELEQKIAKNYPKEFIKAIRVNKRFLDKTHLERLLKLNFPAIYTPHLEAWKYFQETESALWNEIEKEYEKVKNFSFEELLSYCVIWMEEQRFHNLSMLKFEELVADYNFFISLLLSKNENIIKDKVEFATVFNNIVGQIHHENKLNRLGKLLEAISKWNKFYRYGILFYCFDQTTDIIEEHETLYFYQSPQDLYSWKLGDLRYSAIKQYYLNKSLFFAESTKEYPEIDTPIKKINEQNIKLMQNYLLLKDIGIGEIKLENHFIDSLNLLVPIFNLSNSKYENALNNYKSSNVYDSFITAYFDFLNQTIKMEDGVRMPYHFVLKNSLRELLIKVNTASYEEIAEKLSDKVISLFTMDKEKRKTFNRFNVDYNVMEKPFVEIGDFLFSPWMFFSNNDWFYSFSKSVMKDSNSKKIDRINIDTNKHENNIAEKFSKLNFDVDTEIFKNINDGESGDVDIYVEDENTIILIQVKLSFWREKIEDYHNEKLNAETKAIKQLNLAEEYIKSDEKLHKGKKIIKWMVSSSFENLGELEANIWKVNSLELMLILEEFPPETLEKLIMFVKNKGLYKELYDLLHNEEITILDVLVNKEIFQLPENFESKTYKQLLVSKNKDIIEGDILFNKGLELKKDDLKGMVEKTFLKAINKFPYDGDYYGELANTYVDQKKFTEAFVMFEKALELLPNDPFIKRNYSLGLFESGRYYEGMRILLELNNDYPMLGNLRFLFKAFLEYFTKTIQLTPNEYLKLTEAWDKIK